MSRSRAAGRHTDVWRLAVGAVLVAIALGVRSGSPAPSSAASASRPPGSACPSIQLIPPSTDAQEQGWNRHIDCQAGFSVDYPGPWLQYTPPDPGIVFLAGATATDSMEVRIFKNLAVSFQPTDTQSMKVVSDSVLASQKSITVGSVDAVTVAGLPGWQYLYTFKDAGTGATGAHVHIFLFQGNRIITVVFQALPANDLRVLAPTFDLILKKFAFATPPASAPTASPGGAGPSPSRSASATPASPTP